MAKVLIVDELPANRELLVTLLGNRGHQVIVAPDGSNALTLARAEHPDLIIMDVQLPGMSGLEVAQSLKADDSTRAIQIIATTAYALNNDEQKIIESGCDAYMAKPIAVSELLDLVESLITRSPPAHIV